VPKDRVEVTVRQRTDGQRPARRRALQHPKCRTITIVDLVDGGRVTSVARTVFDLGGVLDEQSHLSVIEDARNKALCTDAELGEVYHDLCGAAGVDRRRGSGCSTSPSEWVARRCPSSNSNSRRPSSRPGCRPRCSSTR
jgi:hypothetical protein